MEFHFVLPTTSALSFNDQRALLIKQATAAIISSYLEHASLVNQANPDAGYRYNAQERGRIESFGDADGEIAARGQGRATPSRRCTAPL
jgi:hypothetical protein